MNERALVPSTTTNVARSLDFGSTDFDATDFVPPRVKILQPMSAETTGDARPGDWFNTLTQENYGQVLRIVPITPLKQRVFLFRADPSKTKRVNDALGRRGLSVLPEGEGLMCRSLDTIRGLGAPGDELWADGEKGCRECPLAEWGDRKTPPICTETYNIAGLSEEGDLTIVSMSKSSARTGKAWFSMLRLNDSAPWGQTYELTTVEERNDLGKFWTARVRRVGASATDLMAKAARWYPQLTGRPIDITPVDEDSAGDSRPDDVDLANAAF